MKLAKILGLIFLSAVATNDVLCQVSRLEEVRHLFQKAAVDKRSCFDLVKLLEPIGSADQLLYGYKGANLMISAQYVFNPLGKLSRFTEGKRMLDTALSTGSSNVELRFLRFAIQRNAPSFLGYNRYIEKDRIFLKHALPDVSDRALQ